MIKITLQRNLNNWVKEETNDLKKIVYIKGLKDHIFLKKNIIRA